MRAALALAPHNGAAGKELAELYQASSKRCQALQQEVKELQVGLLVAGCRRPRHGCLPCSHAWLNGH